MHRTYLIPILLSLTMASACSWSDDEAAAPGQNVQGGAEASKALPKIPILPDYKYYVGGVQLGADRHGKQRLKKFQGEVEQPPSRGMIFGAKQDGDELEYRVWGNGILLGLHKGTMKDGLFWQEYAEGYRQGKLVAREYSKYDHEAARVELTVEDIDPDNGEVIRTRELVQSLKPAYIPELEEEDEEEVEEEDASAPAADGAAE